MSLQSEKYGYMPLPKFLPSSFAYHVSTLPEKVRKLFAAWYKQDLNDTPHARYHLQPLTDINDKPYWTTALPILSQYLSGLKFDDPDLVVGRAGAILFVIIFTSKCLQSRSGSFAGRRSWGRVTECSGSRGSFRRRRAGRTGSTGKTRRRARARV